MFLCADHESDVSLSLSCFLELMYAKIANYKNIHCKYTSSANI